MTDDDERTTALVERLAESFPDQVVPLPRILEAAHAGRRQRRRRTAGLVVAIVVAGSLSGLALERLRAGDGAERSVDRIADTPPCDKGNPRPPSEPVPTGPDYPTNAAGETYGGTGRDTGDDETLPDLLAAVGDCGRIGYIRHADLDEPPPWVPGAGSTTDLPSTPVYESDGVTRIDTFTQAGGTAVADGVTDPPAPTDGPDAADVQGTWTATIAGVRAGRKEKYDTYRDLDLWIVFDGDLVRVHDGCRTVRSAYVLDGGSFALTGPDPFALVLGGSDPDCERSAPLPAIVENVRHVTQSGGRTYLHLDDFRIALSLTPAG